MSNHSPVFISVNLNSKIERGSYSWKFNNSLLKHKFASDIRKHFDCVKRDLANSENHGNSSNMKPENSPLLFLNSKTNKKTISRTIMKTLFKCIKLHRIGQQRTNTLRAMCTLNPIIIKRLKVPFSDQKVSSMYKMKSLQNTS